MQFWQRIICLVFQFLQWTRCVHIPKHVAIIMDGNRRWANQHNVHRKEGHITGFYTLEHILHYCQYLGVEIVTVFAFSIENFKRSPDEVGTLMQLAKEKFEDMCNPTKSQLIFENNVKIQVLGNLSHLPEDVREAATRVMKLSENNTKLILNLCFSYTSTDEIQHGLLQKTSSTSQSIPLYTKALPDPDLLIRTSGETRLSDFLTWQTCEQTCFCFLKVMWPDFSLLHLLYCIALYHTSTL